jgi:NADH-quinone oxidoreductase subunit C
MASPDSTSLVASLKDALPDVGVEVVPTVDLHATIFVSRDDMPAVARTLRDRPDLAFTLLAEITAVDFWPREPRYELVYVLVSISRRQRLRLKVRLQGGDAHVATVCAVWPSANWLEREVWDLFGIAFDGHPDHRRLLMPEDWDGHPLRKDYPVQIRMTPHSAEPLQVTVEEFRASVAKDRLARE